MLKMTAYLKETVSQSRLSTQIWEKIQGTVVFLSVSYIKKKECQYYMSYHCDSILDE